MNETCLVPDSTLQLTQRKEIAELTGGKAKPTSCFRFPKVQKIADFLVFRSTSNTKQNNLFIKYPVCVIQLKPQEPTQHSMLLVFSSSLLPSPRFLVQKQNHSLSRKPLPGSHPQGQAAGLACLYISCEFSGPPPQTDSLTNPPPRLPHFPPAWLSVSNCELPLYRYCTS